MRPLFVFLALLGFLSQGLAIPDGPTFLKYGGGGALFGMLASICYQMFGPAHQNSSFAQGIYNTTAIPMILSGPIDFNIYEPVDRPMYPPQCSTNSSDHENFALETVPSGNVSATPPPLDPAVPETDHDEEQISITKVWPHPRTTNSPFARLVESFITSLSTPGTHPHHLLVALQDALDIVVATALGAVLCSLANHYGAFLANIAVTCTRSLSMSLTKLCLEIESFTVPLLVQLVRKKPHILALWLWSVLYLDRGLARIVHLVALVSAITFTAEATHQALRPFYYSLVLYFEMQGRKNAYEVVFEQCQDLYTRLTRMQCKSRKEAKRLQMRRLRVRQNDRTNKAFIRAQSHRQQVLRKLKAQQDEIISVFESIAACTTNVRQRVDTTRSGISALERAAIRAVIPLNRMTQGSAFSTFDNLPQNGVNCNSCMKSQPFFPSAGLRFPSSTLGKSPVQSEQTPTQTAPENDAADDAVETDEKTASPLLTSPFSENGADNAHDAVVTGEKMVSLTFKPAAPESHYTTEDAVETGDNALETGQKTPLPPITPTPAQTSPFFTFSPPVQEETNLPVQQESVPPTVPFFSLVPPVQQKFNSAIARYCPTNCRFQFSTRGKGPKAPASKRQTRQSPLGRTLYLANPSTFPPANIAFGKGHEQPGPKPFNAITFGKELEELLPQYSGTESTWKNPFGSPNTTFGRCTKESALELFQYMRRSENSFANELQTDNGVRTPLNSQEDMLARMKFKKAAGLLDVSESQTFSQYSEQSEQFPTQTVPESAQTADDEMSYLLPPPPIQTENDTYFNPPSSPPVQIHDNTSCYPPLSDYQDVQPSLVDDQTTFACRNLITNYYIENGIPLHLSWEEAQRYLLDRAKLEVSDPAPLEPSPANPACINPALLDPTLNKRLNMPTAAPAPSGAYSKFADELIIDAPRDTAAPADINDRSFIRRVENYDGHPTYLEYPRLANRRRSKAKSEEDESRTWKKYIGFYRIRRHSWRPN